MRDHIMKSKKSIGWYINVYVLHLFKQIYIYIYRDTFIFVHLDRMTSQ